MTKTQEKTKEPNDKSAAETVGTSPQKNARDIQARNICRECSFSV
jgi:hypothetical protein